MLPFHIYVSLMCTLIGAAGLTGIPSKPVLLVWIIAISAVMRTVYIYESIGNVSDVFSMSKYNLLRL